MWMESSSCLRASWELGAPHPKAKPSPLGWVEPDRCWSHKGFLAGSVAAGPSCAEAQPMHSCSPWTAGLGERGRYRQGDGLCAGPTSKLCRLPQDRQVTRRCQAWPWLFSQVWGFIALVLAGSRKQTLLDSSVQPHKDHKRETWSIPKATRKLVLGVTYWQAAVTRGD